MSKRVVTIIVFVVAAIAVMVGVSQRDRFTATGRNARALRDLERTATLVRRSCYSMEAFVVESQWSGMGQSGQQRAAQALAAFCVEQGGSGQMSIFDSTTRRKLAQWNGSALQTF